jgi:uncharacterized protein YndB with AHSA1/START domain
MALPEKPSWVYVTYIVTSPEKIWTALTDPEWSVQYFFGRAMDSDWLPGSPWRMTLEDGRTDSQGSVLEADPPRLLAVSWSVVWMESMRELPPGKVVYRIDDLGGLCRLTVENYIDDTLGPEWVKGGADGWPKILSGLKSLLETGRPLPAFDSGMKV